LRQLQKNYFILPHHFIKYCIGNKTYQLAAPDKHALKNLWDLKKTTHFPYWGKCWPAAIALSEFMVKNTALVRDKQVLELAAGLGLPSLVAAKWAKNVITSDYLNEPLSFVKLSASENGISNIETRIINWHHIPPDLFAEVVLLSDVNYDPASFEALDQLISFFLEQDTLIILSTPQRIMAKPFIEKWMPFQIMQDEFVLEDDVRVTVFVLKKSERGGDRKSESPEDDFL
jgi:predicted nicotinamide N-methyase